MGMFRDTHSPIKRRKNPQNKDFGVRGKLYGRVWNKKTLNYSELPNFLFRNIEAEYCAKGTEAESFFNNAKVKEMKNKEAGTKFMKL